MKPNSGSRVFFEVVLIVSVPLLYKRHDLTSRYVEGNRSGRESHVFKVF